MKEPSLIVTMSSMMSLVRTCARKINKQVRLFSEVSFRDRSLLTLKSIYACKRMIRKY